MRGVHGLFQTDAAFSGEAERIKDVLSRAEQIQGRLWDMAVAHARNDLNANFAPLYLEAINNLSAVHASRVPVGLQNANSKRNLA